MCGDCQLANEYSGDIYMTSYANLMIFRGHVLRIVAHASDLSAQRISLVFIAA